jgi:hypothetical protein
MIRNLASIESPKNGNKQGSPAPHGHSARSERIAKHIVNDEKVSYLDPRLGVG